MSRHAVGASSCFVIAITGASGAGKSTLVKALLQILEDSGAISFDEYDPRYVPTTKYPVNITQWVNEGADPDLWETPQLVADLHTLRNGQSITLPKNKGVLQPTSFILLEEPFGRERTPMKNLVDFVIALDTPLEIALARRLLEIPDLPYFIEHPQESYPALLQYLRNYLFHSSRELYLAVNARVYKNCDLILDGRKPIDELAENVAKMIRAVSM
ncbi:MAG TPA: ATP-binding cassette domain-containing protein [Ktedonobacteraceae bacterium]|nr:ATP-binding cassette domain-containing protein [Ktedonobacteraceae bacterium]